MKRLFYSIVLLASLALAFPVIAASTELIGSSLRLTNVLGNGYSLINSVGDVTLYGPAGSPRIALTHTGTPGWTEILQIGDNLFSISGAPIGGGTAVPISLIGNVSVTGNLSASGTVTGSAIVYSLTNITYATNAMMATNDQWGNVLLGTNGIYADTNLYKLAQSYYPTNESVNIGGTNVLTDMAIPYADVNWVTNMYFGRCTNLSDTKYQTAVRMLHGGPATGADIGFDTLTTVVGTRRFTNYCIVTFFWNPATSKTNALCVPMY